jgi:hypothetical protein
MHSHAAYRRHVTADGDCRAASASYCSRLRYSPPIESPSSPATPDLSPQRAIFAAEYVMLGDGAKAARAAGYAHPKQSAYRLINNPDVAAHIERLKAQIALQTGYTIAQWEADLREMVAEARVAGSHSAAMKEQELLGRYVGALSNERRPGDGERVLHIPRHGDGEGKSQTAGRCVRQSCGIVQRVK